MMFSDIVPSIGGTLTLVRKKLFFHALQRSQWNITSIAFVLFGCILLLTTPNAVVLSVCIGVGGCLWPNSSSSCRSGMASRKLM